MRKIWDSKVEGETISSKIQKQEKTANEIEIISNINKNSFFKKSGEEVILLRSKYFKDLSMDK